MNKKVLILSIAGALVITGLIIGLVLWKSEKKSPKDEEQMQEPVEEQVEEVKIPMEEWREKHLKVKGIYVTAPVAGTEQMDDIIKLVDETELNAIVLDVKDDNGNITFPMDNDAVKDMDASYTYIEDINKFLKKLKKKDIYVIARIPCFKDPILAEKRPELALTAPDGTVVTDGSGNKWVDPCNEEVWKYISSLIDSCCELGFDEIQLDYVRFPVGKDAEKALSDKAADDANRQSYITEFLTMASEEAHKYDVPLAADVFGTIIKSQEDANHVGQDYVTLVSNLDIICPMIYPSHYGPGEFGLDVPDAKPYETIYGALEGSKTALASIPEGEGAIVRPWLQAFTATWVDGHITYDGDAIRKQIQAVNDIGYEEWILWNAKSSYSSDGLEPSGKAGSSKDSDSKTEDTTDDKDKSEENTKEDIKSKSASPKKAQEQPAEVSEQQPTENAIPPEGIETQPAESLVPAEGVETQPAESAPTETQPADAAVPVE